MLGFNEQLIARDCVVLKQFRQAEDRCICLVQYSDGSKAVWRCYDRPVPAYEKLVGIKCDELPELYRYTATECGGCLVEEEFVDGISLAELIYDNRLDELQTAAIARRICKALAVLHRLDMVHRDVKPENIFVTSKGRVVLIDLDAVSPKSSSKDRDTRLLGTVGYAAPEQYGFGHSDGRADIFGVGVLMNVLLTGKHPARQLAGGNLRKVIEKCIAINVDQRYATVEQLMVQLPEGEDKYCPDCGFLSPGGGCIFCGIPTSEGSVRRKRKAWVLAAGLLILALVVAGAGIARQTDNFADNSTKDTSTMEDNELEQSDSIPGQPDPQVNNTPTPSGDIMMQDIEEQSDNGEVPDEDIENTDVQEPTVDTWTNQPSAEPIHSQEPQEVSPSPQSTIPDTEVSVPVYTGAPVSAVSAFSYDLNGDGLSEEYYFGLLLDSASQPKFSARDVIGPLPELGDHVIRQVAPAVWKQDESGNLIPEEGFADLLKDPGISLYEYRETDTVLSIQAAAPLYGCWRGASAIEYSYGDAGMWVMEAHSVLDGVTLSAAILAVIRDESSVNDAQPQEIMRTDGAPVGEALAISWHSLDELVIGEYTVYDCTAQLLDNEYIRFAVDFIGPKGLNITAFDPPDGELFKYTNRFGSSGEREQFVFDIPTEQVRAAGKLTITFSYENGSRFLVCIDEVGGL